jgi:hypothetical protein
MSLNKEIIKIFIEGWLVKYHDFSIIGDGVGKDKGGFNLLFQLDGSILELRDINQKKVLISIEIPEDLDAKHCMAFAMRFYIQVAKVCEKEKH